MGIKPKQVGFRHEKVGEKRRVRETCRDSHGVEAATQQLQETGGGRGLLGRVEFTPWGFFKGDDAAPGGRAPPQNHEILICVAFSLTETTRRFRQIADKDWKTRLFNQKIRKEGVMRFEYIH